MTASSPNISWQTACALVISNMVGTGVFTSLGFQLDAVQSTWSILLLWVMGGVLALIGAFTFAELGTHYAGENGGDYVFIGRGFHPLLGYVSAWVSLVGGFAAPVAIAGKAMEAYLAPFGLPHLRLLTVGLILLLGLLHSVSLRQSSVVQNSTTLLKIGFIALLLAVGFWYLPVPNNALQWEAITPATVVSGPFAVSLIYVTYAYTGWNAAAYIVAEIREPRRNLPKALLLGTLGVVAVYVALQLVLLKFARLDQLRGQIDVAVVALGNVLGTSAGRWVGVGIAVQLIATMSFVHLDWRAYYAADGAGFFAVALLRPRYRAADSGAGHLATVGANAGPAVFGYARTDAALHLVCVAIAGYTVGGESAPHYPAAYRFSQPAATVAAMAIHCVQLICANVYSDRPAPREPDWAGRSGAGGHHLLASAWTVTTGYIVAEHIRHEPV